jgi:hypothetical protein
MYGQQRASFIPASRAEVAAPRRAAPKAAAGWENLQGWPHWKKGNTVMDICVPPLACRLPIPAEAASHFWFSAAHVALVVSIAALVVTIVVSALTLYYLRRSTRAYEDSARAAGDSATSSKASAKAAEDSATSAREPVEVARESVSVAEDSAASAKVSAEAAEDSAKAAKVLVKIEQAREYDRTRPKLWGRLVPEPGGPAPVNAWLEAHLDASTPQPLQSLLLTVPTGAWFGRGSSALPSLMSNDFGFPGEPGQEPPIRPGWPARWRVYRADNAHGTLTATAKCTREDGKIWWDVEVPISQDFDETGPDPP